jgi:hypothetical protein
MVTVVTYFNNGPSPHQKRKLCIDDILYVPGIYRIACQCGSVCILDKAERISRQGVKNARCMYVCINPSSQQWKNIASSRFIASISVAPQY